MAAPRKGRKRSRTASSSSSAKAVATSKKARKAAKKQKEEKKGKKRADKRRSRSRSSSSGRRKRRRPSRSRKRKIETKRAVASSSGTSSSGGDRKRKRGVPHRAAALKARNALTIVDEASAGGRPGGASGRPQRVELVKSRGVGGPKPSARGTCNSSRKQLKRKRQQSDDASAGSASSSAGAEDAAVSECTGEAQLCGEAASGESSGSYYYTDEEEEGPPKPERKEDIQHVDWTEGMMLKSRYRVKKLLGDGTFGRVLLATDEKKRRSVAIKVIREVEKYVRNAKREAEILRDIRVADPKAMSGCVAMYDTFTHDGKLFCLAFEVLGPSLYDVLKRNRFRGFWMQDIQSIAKQTLEALAFLHGQLKLAHTDLKLENVLFQSSEPLVPANFPREASFLERHKKEQSRPLQYVRPPSPKIKLIDFGNATYELEHHSSIINTRQYRAPEVILQLGWNELSDQWSTGCILMELYTGELLFRTHDSLEHLHLMERCLQMFPAAMLNEASDVRKSAILSEEPERSGLWKLRWPPNGRTDIPPADPSRAPSESKVLAQPRLDRLVAQEHRLLADFVSSLLRQDPKQRPSAAKALKHPFLSMPYPD